MTSDIENLTKFYANLPSIFETNPLSSIESSSTSSNGTITLNDHEKAYQPMFGSFLFADSEPFTKAAFVTSKSSSIEVKPIEQEEEEEDHGQQIEKNFISKENNNQTKELFPLALTEDISDMDDDDDDSINNNNNNEDQNDDEDDFDGIPIRHGSSITNEKMNGDDHLIQNTLIDKLAHSVENENIDDDDGEDLFLNGFTDEEHHHYEQEQDDKTKLSSLFNNIPDIDDLNEHEDDNDDRILFDNMDMFDQSDSIRSSSPDSVLSSSHLRDEDDDMNNNDDDIVDGEDDVTQWNDDYLLGRINLQNDRPNAPLPPSIVLNIHPHDQVDFIDSSRSNSRCSNASSANLSTGYVDQARTFLNDDDGLVTSSDSESDHNDYHNENIQFENEGQLIRDNSEEPCLEVNLDYHRSKVSPTSYSQSNSTHSSRSSSPAQLPLPIPDQSPIIDIDEEINETKNSIQSAPIAIVDDDDDDDDYSNDNNTDNLQTFMTDQPVLSSVPSKNLLELRNEYRQNDIVHDIINIRHFLNENDNDDEFLAIMHNPTVFEEVLYDHDEQKSDLVGQTNVLTNTFQPSSSQLSIDNKNQNESIEQYQNLSSTTLLTVSNNETNSSPNVITTNDSSLYAVNHLSILNEEQAVVAAAEEENVDSVNRSRIELKKTQQSLDKNITNINIKPISNSEQEQQDHYQMMSSDDESDNDSELLETLAQLHGLVHTSPRLSSENGQIDVKNDEEETNHHHHHHLLSNSNIDKKSNMINLNNDDKNQMKLEEEKKPSTFFPLTSLTSSTLFNNDDESPSRDIILDSDVSSSLITSNYDLNTSILSANQFENDNLQVINQNQQELENSMLSSFDSDITAIVEKLVSSTLQLAFYEVQESNRQIEQFVEQILSQAIYEVYNEDEDFSTKNLESIMNWHQQRNYQSLDPFDQKFHNLWISHFETPDDTDSASFYANTLNQTDLLSSTSNQTNPLPFINLFDSSITNNDLLIYSLETSVKKLDTNNNSSFQDDFIFDMNESSNTTDDQINNESKDFSSHENHDDDDVTQVSSRIETDETIPQYRPKHESFLENQQRLSQFDVFASDHPLNLAGIESIAEQINNEFNQSSLQIQHSTNTTDNEPWELEDNSEEKLKPIPTVLTRKQDSYNNNYFPDSNTLDSIEIPREQDEDESTGTESNNEHENENNKENYDEYFSKYESNENTKTIENSLSKNVRFNDTLENIDIITPKNSINRSESISTTTTSDSDENDNEEQIEPNLRTNNNQINEEDTNNNETNDVVMRDSLTRPLSNVSLTESDELPPPLPPLPPLNNKPTNANDNIPNKSPPTSNLESKRKTNLRSPIENTTTMPTTTDTTLYNKTDSQFPRSNDSAILRSISKEDSNIDSDENNGVITCMIDNNQISIDAKTISPFKCVVASAGQLDDENQTAVITLYGCWLPDHRLREYRYIMDQLFYYVYHKLEKLVINNYVLIYFHGATPKHRTPDLKFLRKCYQMINFRLRKNLRAVYVVHPTRWLRTVIALSRPFFSNKFYHKVHYLFTIAELEKEFPNNQISIPIIIEQTDWLYSQRYDRQNASIKRSIERAGSRPVSGIENESSA